MIEHKCENCQKVLNISDKYAGQQGKCKHCGAAIQLPQGFVPSSSPPPPLPTHQARHPESTYAEKVAKNTHYTQMTCGVLMLGFLVLCFGLFIGIMSLTPSDEQIAINDAIWEVKLTIKEDLLRVSAGSDWKGAPLGGGIGVLSELDWAYWVKDGVAYHANGLAMSASPNTARCPVGIGHSEIEKTIEKYEGRE